MIVDCTCKTKWNRFFTLLYHDIFCLSMISEADFIAVSAELKSAGMYVDVSSGSAGQKNDTDIP